MAKIRENYQCCQFFDSWQMIAVKFDSWQFLDISQLNHMFLCPFEIQILSHEIS